MNEPSHAITPLRPADRRTSLGTVLWRAVRLRCPLCGNGPLFAGWLRMQPRCSSCHFHFERGPGYWLGSIYVNYGLTALIVTGSFFALFFSEAISQTATLWILTAFCVLFPLWFFLYARAVWIALDTYFDPPPESEFEPPDPAAAESLPAVR